MRSSDAAEYDEPRDALARDWTPLFEEHGLCPVLLPSNAVDVTAWANELDCRALLLTGGESVGQNTSRDTTEFALLDWAMERQLPVFGVCRGLHLIQRYFGGQLEDVPAPDQHIAAEHGVELSPELKSAFDGASELSVNSYHGQRIGAPADELVSLARTADGTTEVIRHRTAPVRAVQCHPERPGCDPRLIDWLLAPLLR